MLLNYFQWTRKNLIFWVSFLGYWLFYINRKSFIYIIPFLLTDSTMSLTREHFGMMASIQMTFYTIGKFVAGIVVDRMSGRLIFSLSMLICGLSNFAYGFCSGSVEFYIITVVNGLFQALPWCVIAVLIRRWFDKTEFGTVWSLISASMNASNSLSPFLIAELGKRYLWRNAFIIIGSVTCLLSFPIYLLLKDSPTESESLNSPTHTGKKSPSTPERVKKKELFVMQTPSARPSIKSNITLEEKAKPESITTKNQVTYVDILKSPFIWILTTGSLFWSIVKVGTEDWLQLYLITDRKFSDITCNFNLMAFQIGGLFSTVMSGIISDVLVRKFQAKMRSSPRLLVVLFFTLTVLLWFYLLHFNRMMSTKQVTVSCFFLGLCCYGPHNLFGITVIESAPMELSGFVQALFNTISSVGLVLGGYPLVYISSNYGWNGAYFSLMAASLLSSGFLLIATRLDSEFVKKKVE